MSVYCIHDHHHHKFIINIIYDRVDTSPCSSELFHLGTMGNYTVTNECRGTSQPRDFWWMECGVVGCLVWFGWLVDCCTVQYIIRSSSTSVVHHRPSLRDLGAMWSYRSQRSRYDVGLFPPRRRHILCKMQDDALPCFIQASVHCSSICKGGRNVRSERVRGSSLSRLHSPLLSRPASLQIYHQ